MDRLIFVPSQPDRDLETQYLGSLDASMETHLIKLGFKKLQAKGEFERAKTDTMPEIRFSVNEMICKIDPASQEWKAIISYTLESNPKNPLFFHHYRGEISGAELATRIQSYLAVRAVYADTRKNGVKKGK